MPPIGAAIVKQTGRVALGGDPADLGVGEAEVAELLLGVHRVGPGLVQGGQILQRVLRGHRAALGQLGGPLVGDLRQLGGVASREVPALGGADLGRIDHRQHVARLDRLAEVGTDLAEEAVNAGADLGVAVGVVGRLGVGREVVGVPLLVGRRPS